MKKFLRKFENILKRLCDETYRSDRARHGYQYFITKVGYAEFCVQVSSTPKNKKKVGHNIRRDLLYVLRQLDVCNVNLESMKMSFTTFRFEKSVWEEIEDLSEIVVNIDDD